MWKYLLLSTLILVAPATLLAAPLNEPAPTGDLHPSYTFDPTGETMAYRLYVPPTYDAKNPVPLVVLLHGAGGSENSVFAGADGPMIERLADQHHFIVMSPRGYAGGYGDIYPVVVTRETAARSKPKPNLGDSVRPDGVHAAGRPATTPQAAVAADDYTEQAASELTPNRQNQLSEQETLAAIGEVRKEYNIDPNRMYLTGNSMGGVGTAYLAAKYPTMWAAIAPGGGPVAAWSYPFERLRNAKLPVLYVHGQFDQHSNPHWSDVVYKDARTEGVDAALLIVEGASHERAWVEALPRIFDFFDAHHR